MLYFIDARYKLLDYAVQVIANKTHAARPAPTRMPTKANHG